MEIESISKVNLVKGDVVVVSIKQILPEEQGLEFLLSLKKMFPDNECILLEDGATISIISKEESPEVPDPHGPIYYDTKGGM